MAFAHKKMYAKLVADTDTDLQVIVLKSPTPAVLAGGIIASQTVATTIGGVPAMKVNVTACKYIKDSKVATCEAVSAGGVVVLVTGDSVVVDIAGNTVAAMASASVSAAVAAKTHLQLGSCAFTTTGTLAVTAKRRMLQVAVNV